MERITLSTEFKYDKPVVVGMATYGTNRRAAIKKAIASLSHQVNYLYLYDNEVEKQNLTDNGKFFGLSLLDEPVYYFVCDDDVEYPATYIDDMIKKIKEHQCIVTHHGRTLQRLDVPYYRAHKCFRCLNDVITEELIDVPGTCVTGWDTAYFNPKDIWNAKDLKMSDIIFGLEAAKQDKKIMVLKHRIGYFKHLDIDMKQTIWFEQHNNCERQTELANEIFKIKH